MTATTHRERPAVRTRRTIVSAPDGHRYEVHEPVDGGNPWVVDPTGEWWGPWDLPAALVVDTIRGWSQPDLFAPPPAPATLHDAPAGNPVVALLFPEREVNR